jgi:hypothetical protein
MLTQAQVEKILGLLDDEQVALLDEFLDSRELNKALYARHPQVHEEENALAQAVGGLNAPVLAVYQQAESSQSADFERAAFLKGLLFGNLGAMLFGDTARKFGVPQAPPKVGDMQPPALAWEFVTILQETAQEALREWLEKNNAPKAALDLSDRLTSLQLYVDQAREGKVLWAFNVSIAQDVRDIANLIAELGGVFHGPDSVSIRREVG